MTNEIYLSWRKGVGSSRHLVGLLRRDWETGRISFKYITENIKAAQDEGFRYYPEFPELTKEYTENIMDILSIRLIPNDRPDRAEYLRFWEADEPTLSPFDILALTQGKLPTDNFEFIGNFYYKKNFQFVTDVARLSHTQLLSDEVRIGDRLDYEYDKENLHDDGAVRLLLNGKEIGHVKRGHTNFFQSAKESPLDLTVKAISKNGTIKSIYLLVKS